MKGKESFELQLVVIGILIPVYLNIFPLLIEPLIFPNITLTLQAPKIISYALGFLWFVCLLFGTYSLIEGNDFIKKRSRKAYEKLFTFTNRFTVFWLVSIVTAYLTTILTDLLSPVFRKHTWIAVFLTILLFILLLVFFLFKDKLLGGEQNVK